MAATGIIISDSTNTSYDGNLATTNGFYQVEAWNVGTYRESQGKVPAGSIETINVTFANAGNCQGLMLSMGYVIPTTTTVTLEQNQDCTLSISSPGIVTLATHGLVDGVAVKFATTGALPTGLTAGTIYYVYRIDADTFWVCDTYAHAIAHTNRVNFTGTQSGTQSYWTIRATKALAKTDILPTDGTSTVDTGGRTYVCFVFTSPYAVTTDAGRWRFLVTGSGVFYLGTSDSGDLYPTYAAWCDNKVSHVDGNVIIVKDVIDIDKTFTTGGVLGTSELTAPTSMIICCSADAVTPLLTCFAPAASYTWTVQGLVIMGTRSVLQFGTSTSVPISAANMLDVVFNLAPLVGTVTPKIWVPQYYGTRPGGIFMYGEVPTQPILTLSADAAINQKIFYTNETPTCVAGDTLIIGKQNLKGAGDVTVYTIDAGGVDAANKKITLTANIATNVRKAGGHVLIKGHYGIRIRNQTPTGTNSSNWALSYISNLTLSGVEFDNIYMATTGNDLYGVENPAKTSKHSITDCQSWNTNYQLTDLRVPPKGAIVQRVYSKAGCPVCAVAATYTSTFYSGTLEVKNCVIFSTISSIQISGYVYVDIEDNYFENSSTAFIDLQNATDPIIKNNYYWGMTVASYLGCLTMRNVLNSGTGIFSITGNHYNQSLRGIEIGHMTNGGNYNLINPYLKSEVFGGEVANTTDIIWGYGSYSDVTFDSCIFTTIDMTSYQAYTLPLSKTRFIAYNNVTNDDRVYTTYGNFQKTGPSPLTDTTTHTIGTGKFAIRFQPISSTKNLPWTFSIPIANINTYSMTVSCWVKINNAAYYGGTKVMPTLSINYDNGTVVTDVAEESVDWQQLTYTFTPVTSYGQITVSIYGSTAATSTNAYFYVDDMGLTYPTGYSANLGMLDLWANALPITPSSDTSGYISYDWTQDPYVVASEATAAAYSGIAINYSTKVIAVTTSHTITELYEYCKASARAAGVTYALSTKDGVTYNLAGGWTLTITGCSVTSATQKFGATPTLGANGFVEQVTGITWYDGTHTYYAKHVFENVKDSATSSNQQYAVVACIDSGGVDRTYNTSLTNGGLTTDSSGNAEAYYVYKIDSTTYTISEYIGLYGYSWSVIPTPANGTAIGASGTYNTVRLVADPFVTLSRTAALAITGVTVSHSTTTVDLGTRTLTQAQDYMKAKQASTSVIEGTTKGYMSYYADGWYLSNNGSAYTAKTSWRYLNSGDTQTLAGGILVESTPGTINDPVNTVTYDFASAGTYDLRGATILGTIHLETTNNSTVTVKLLPGVTYVNDTPAHITVDNAFNVTLAVNNIIAGSRIQVYDTDSSTELYNEIVAGTTFTKTYVYSSDVNIRIRLMYVDGVNAYSWYTATTAITSSGFSVNAAQVVNAVYEDANIDGSTVTECSVSGTTIRIYVDDPDNTTTAQRIYNWYQYYLFTEAGIREQDGTYVTATDATHYIFANTMKIINSDTANPLNITGANITPVSGAASNIFDVTNGASIILNFNRVEGFSYSSGSGLSTEEHNALIDQKATIDTNLDKKISQIPQPSKVLPSGIIV